jgi:DNA replication and repair protein RecF
MISSLRLQNFRSYSDSSFEFDPGVNIVVGPNASGKTNLLEAILAMSQGGSYRVKDIDLIKHQAPWSRLDGFFASQTRTLKLELEPAPTKAFIIDDKPFKRLGFERTLPIVLFEPNHLQLITRGPNQRRNYFDDLLDRSQPGFKQLAGAYRRTLAQRNALLKQRPENAKSQLFAWNIRLSELGGQVVAARTELIDDINQKIGVIYSQIAHQSCPLELTYETQFPVEHYSSKMVAKLERNAAHEFDRGFTAYGPHREDISFYLNNRQVIQTASRGETRSLLLSLKIYELELIEKARAQKPIFLLDDVFSELDGARRRALVDYLKEHQTVITTTEADAVIEYFSGKYNLIAL